MLKFPIFSAFPESIAWALFYLRVRVWRNPPQDMAGKLAANGFAMLPCSMVDIF